MGPRPLLTVTSVTIGAPAPRDLAAFYARLLGWPVTASEPAGPGMPPEDGWAQLRPPAGENGPTLNFEYEREFTRPVWPAADGAQNATQHLDIAVGDLDEAVRWALAAGAVLADVQPQDDVRVMFDPVGHPFCLFADVLGPFSVPHIRTNRRPGQREVALSGWPGPSAAPHWLITATSGGAARCGALR
jgi:catechol 2,3-dioxygenase-like lactoylglutathione lyase family enzyme